MSAHADLVAAEARKLEMETKKRKVDFEAELAAKRFEFEKDQKATVQRGLAHRDTHLDAQRALCRPALHACTGLPCRPALQGARASRARARREPYA